MTKETFVIDDDQTYLTLQEICVICHLSENELSIFIEQAIVQPDPLATSSNEMKFNSRALQRLQKALRLERDLHINHEGVAVVLNLLEELDELRSRLHIYERHY